MSDTAFDLPERLSAKADPALIGPDEQHFAAIARTLEASIADLEARLEAERRAPGGMGQAAMDRDLEIHRLSSRLRTLRRFGLDLCLGRMVPADGSAPVYVGRLGLTDDDGERLLVDWRSPAAEPFFGATHANPMGLTSRRRYRWTRGRISDYWDEVSTVDGMAGRAALDDQSAFIASLGSNRSERMRDVLGTIQADQDAIIRAGSRGALVVDGGPGTGKTVVALHRAAYLLHADPRVNQRHGGVLVVGPHQPYLAYVGDVLPSLGEEGAQTCTLRDLVPQGRSAQEEADPAAARLKASTDMVAAIEPAVRLYEEPPGKSMLVETPWSEVRVDPEDWAEAFAAAEPGAPHNEVRHEVWEELLTILVDKHRLGGNGADGEGADGKGADGEGADGDAGPDLVRRALRANRDLVDAFDRAWTIVEPTDLVGDLWTVPAYLRRCAPWLSPTDVRALQRDRPDAWTVSDLPLLDAARRRLGDSGSARRQQREQAERAFEREQMDRVIDELVQTDDDAYGVGLVSTLRHQDLRETLVDDSGRPGTAADGLVGPFAHVVVDEAQELTDAEWQMLLARCPSRSFTIVGDRAQARHGFTESWEERLGRIGLDRVQLAALSINYRTPVEVMAEAEPVIRAALPDANVPTSVRSTGVPVTHGAVTDLDTLLAAWLDEHDADTTCVIGTEPRSAALPHAGDRLRTLTPELAKGLEFDLVVLIEPDGFGQGIAGAVDRYVAMTRATQRLVVLTNE